MPKNLIPSFSSDAARVLHDSKVIAVLHDQKFRELLEVFMRQTASVKLAAELVQRDLKRTFNDVQTLLRYELLVLDRLEPRAGRPVRWYRASATNFFVPFMDSAFSGYADLLVQEVNDLQRTMHQSFEAFLHELDPQEWGTRFFLDPDGKAHFALTPKDDWQRNWLLDELLSANAPALMFTSVRLQLSVAQSKALQLELAELWSRWYFLAQQNADAVESLPFGFGLGLAPLK